MISPVIFCTIVLGVGSVASAAQVGKVGGLALGYFLVMSTVALAIGLVVGNLLHPGLGPGPDRRTSPRPAPRRPARPAAPPTSCSGIIPTTLFSALTEGEVLQTLLVALLVGFARAGDGRGRPAGAARRRAHPARGLPGAGDDHVGRADRRVRRDRRVSSARPAWTRSRASAMLMVAFYVTCALFVFVVLGHAAAAGHRRQHLQRCCGTSAASSC